MLAVNALLSFVCCWFLTEAQKFYGSGQIRTFGDLSQKCFGTTGYLFVTTMYYLNQFCICVSYAIFFLGTISVYFQHRDPHYTLLLLMLVLAPLAMILRSMKAIQYLQTVALTSILLAIFSVMITSLDFI